MKIPCILFAAAVASSAAVTPYVSADFGMTIPRLDSKGLDDENLANSSYDFDWSAEGSSALAWSVGGGVQVPLSGLLALDLFANYASMPYDADFAGTMTIDESGFEGEMKMGTNLEIITSLIDAGIGSRYSATEKFGVSGAFVYSHILSSEYDGKLYSSWKYTSTSGESGSDETKRSISGDLESIESDVADTTEEIHGKGYKCKPQDFFSVRLMADYAVTPALAITAGYIFPLTDHLEGKTLSGAIHRATAGIRWSFGAL